MFRISLREMLVLVAMIALAIASLKYADSMWLGIIAGVTMAVLFGALIVAGVDRGRRQAFAIGLALTIIAYGAVLLTGYSVPAASGNSKNVEFDQWEGRLPTTRLLRPLYAAVKRSDWETVPRTLKIGTSSGMVASLQQALNERTLPSPNIEVDGDFGSETLRAVKSFQTQAGLEATGVVESETWKSLGPLLDARTGEAFPIDVPDAATANSGGVAFGGGGLFRESPPRRIFMTIGHCWWALILGYVGGHFAQLVYRGRLRDEEKLPADTR